MKNSISDLITLASEGKAKEFEIALKQTLKQMKEAKINKFGSRVKREVLNMKDFNENTFDILRDVVETKNAIRVKLQDGNVARVDFVAASALVKVYDDLNFQNQEKMKELLTKNNNGYQTVLDFALTNTR